MFLETVCCEELNPNVVRFYEHFPTRFGTVIVCEYVTGNTLEHQFLAGRIGPCVTAPSNGRRASFPVSRFDEVVRALSDERYDVDPAYRAAVAQKLERSNLEF